MAVHYLHVRRQSAQRRRLKGHNTTKMLRTGLPEWAKVLALLHIGNPYTNQLQPMLKGSQYQRHRGLTAQQAITLTTILTK